MGLTVPGRMLVVFNFMEICRCAVLQYLLMIFAAGQVAANSASKAQAPAASASSAAAKAPAAAPEPEWVKRSNQYTQMLLDVQFKHSPEGGSRQGLAKYDPLITDPTRADEIVQRKELQDVLATLKKVEAKEKDKDVREDLEILQKTFNLQFRQDDYQLDHKVPFIDASAAVFGGLRSCWTTRWPRSGGRRPWSGCASTRAWNRDSSRSPIC